jgi:hypothetical protein
MKNLVAGKIFVDGSGRGIADLVVALYDLDPALAQEFAEGGISLDDPIDSLLTLKSMRTWLEFPGDRIGSVLTDRYGRFELPFQDEEFQIRNSEKRPDLLLFVFGPDRAQGNHPFQRLLHYAWVPRVNAGRLEHFSIAIELEHLRNKGVVLDRQFQEPEAYVNGERQNINRRLILQSNLHSLFREQITSTRERRNRARLFSNTIVC